jgi:gamma-glutamylcyclotransferase (GGCT)/AIG2-like uncharacterized protein YtfP
VNVFTYGTLQFPDVFAAVSGARVRAEDAVLPGHRREGVRGQVYPAIVADPRDETPGCLYRDVPRPALRFLDAFEGPEYLRVVRPVRTASGATVPAACYVIAPGCAGRLDGRPWDAEAFRARHHGAYLRRCRRLYRAYRAGRLDRGARVG